MKITDVRADFLRTGSTLLRIFTDDGVVGLADASWYHDRTAFAWLDEVIRPRLVGHDPRQPARHWDRLAFGAVEGTPQETGPAAGMIMDFADLRRRVDEAIVHQLDHQFLNDVFDFVPTVEAVAAWAFERLTAEGVPVVKVRLAEGPNSWVEVSV